MKTLCPVHNRCYTDMCCEESACITINYCRTDASAFKTDLLNIAKTTLSSKILSHHKDLFSNLAVDAVLRLKVIILDYLA